MRVFGFPAKPSGMARHPSGGTATGPICQPDQRDVLEHLWHRLTSPHNLPLIRRFFFQSPSCPATIQQLLSFATPHPSHALSFVSFSFCLFESSDLSKPPLTVNRWACLLFGSNEVLTDIYVWLSTSELYFMFALNLFWYPSVSPFSLPLPLWNRWVDFSYWFFSLKWWNNVGFLHTC